jgi:hypothetical protein
VSQTWNQNGKEAAFLEEDDEHSSTPAARKQRGAVHGNVRRFVPAAEDLMEQERSRRIERSRDH